ncbi:hypothetical protein BHM03_00004916 [Ensete ventricosum]|uniref:Uncharacterized protein n=1 Tax=Ensete ventricosum TaxID=4639 RepID=A0A427AB52_ENSVE|nr:hypothetical protein B296_00005155 [Ensete ventricosum]RZR79245.1 hypothetical protein BHM03_00004916 [Ensete ventricosum]
MRRTRQGIDYLGDQQDRGFAGDRLGTRRRREPPTWEVEAGAGDSGEQEAAFLRLYMAWRGFATKVERAEESGDL